MQAIYDLDCWQPTFVYVLFLMSAEMERIDRQHADIQVEIWKSERGGGYGPLKRFPNSVKQATRWFDGIIPPMTRMLPSVTAFRIVDAKDRPTTIGNAFSLGTKFCAGNFMYPYIRGIRPLRSSIPDTSWREFNKMFAGSPLVTMTLRECGARHWDVRDSRVEEWQQAAIRLEQEGCRVVVLRDTRFARLPLEGTQTWPEASLNLEARAMLYQRADCNLFVSNGPAYFCLALDAPTIMFRPTCETGPKSARPESMANYGIVTGLELPGAPSHQRLSWLDETADNIVDETKRFLEARCTSHETG